MPYATDMAHLYAGILREYPGEATVAAVLARQAATLTQAHQEGDPAASILISNWFPPLAAATTNEIMQAAFSLDDARLTVAREHGFADWAAVEAAGDRRFDPAFEQAADAVVGGDMTTLATLLRARPDLAQATSPYGHRATLLHYVAANGVETWRQQSPANAAEIARLLINAGADPAAKARVYGGQFDTMALLLTSSHPAEAGVTEAVAAVLQSAAG